MSKVNDVYITSQIQLRVHCLTIKMKFTFNTNMFPAIKQLTFGLVFLLN